MPTRTVAPLRFISETPCSAAPLTPTVTNTQSALRPPVSALTRSATSSPFALIVSVAPNSRAAASLAGSMSTAMIGEQPASRAPWMEFKPTPPQPMTTTLEPALTFAVLTTAPIPVSTPQAMRAALSSAHVVRDRHRLGLVDHHPLGEGAGAQPVDERLAVAVVQRGCAIEREHLLAEHRRAFGAGRAEAAIADQRRDDMIAGLEAGHARADRLDHARRLVAVDRRQFPAPGAVE